MFNRAIGAAVVTIPSCAYLLQSRPKTDHDHGHNDSDHHEHEEGHEDEAKVEDGEGDDRDAEQSEGGSGGDTEEGGDADGTSNDDNKDSGSVEPTRPDDTVEDAGQGTPENPGDNYPKGGGHVVESGGNVEGVRFKGATGAGTKEGEGGRPEMGDTRKHIPDAKGGAKKRIESDYGKPQGKLWDGHDDDSNRVRSHGLRIL